MYAMQAFGGCHILNNRSFPDPSAPTDGYNVFTPPYLSDGSVLNGETVAQLLADELGCSGGISSRYFVRPDGRIQTIVGNGINFYTFDVYDSDSNGYDFATATAQSATLRIGGYLPAWIRPLRAPISSTPPEFQISHNSSGLPTITTALKYSLADATYDSPYTPAGNIFLTVLEPMVGTGGNTISVSTQLYRGSSGSNPLGNSFGITVSTKFSWIGTDGALCFAKNSGFWDNDGSWVVGTNMTATWNMTQTLGHVSSTGVVAINTTYQDLPSQSGVGWGVSSYVGSTGRPWGYTFIIKTAPGGGVRCRLGFRKQSDGTWVYGSWFDTTGRHYETMATVASGFNRVSIETEGSGFDISAIQVIGGTS